MLQYLIHHMSYGLIIFVLMITGSGIPIPEEVVVILAAVASKAEQLEWPIAYLSCVVGSLCGDCLMYAIGRHFGRGVLFEHPWFARFITPEREQRVERLITQYGFRVYFLARFLVGIRSPVFLTAGILRVPFHRFLLVDFISATAVVSMFFGLGYAFADNIMSWLKWIRRFEVAMSLLVVLAVIGLVIWLWRRRQARWASLLERRRQRQARRIAASVDPTPPRAFEPAPATLDTPATLSSEATPTA